MQKLRKLWVGAVSLLLTMIMVIPAFAAGVTVNIDGVKVDMGAQPVIESGRTLVPIGPLAEQLGGDASYDSTSKTVSIVTTDKVIKLTIGSKAATVNGSSETLDVPAKIESGRTMVPIRFVSEALGAKVSYDATSRTVNVKYFSDMSGTLKIGGSTTIQPIAQAAADKLSKLNQGLSVSVAGGGSGEGIKGASNGTFNIGGVSRDLEAADNTAYPGLKSYQIGTDGIVVIVNPQNPISNLSKQQVIDIFTGKTQNWKDVGGSDSAIFIQTREAGSGTLTAFEELALAKAKVATTATPYTSNGLIKEAVSKNINAVGFLSMGYLDNSVKAPQIAGVKPFKSNALSHTWPYVRSLNVITKGSPSGLTAKFINYLRSPQGQSLVSVDYLPLKAVD